ncbi:MAG TPA: FliH/SctL family protein [Rhodoferax sp.]|jgi:flagellar assembly protein FliH|nr:FliH/SctL family protein [Rhodoferax sp.]HOF51861.1 FliH/SctL family protein [Rhodoferax sp.]HQY75719.1 FliH/SctL family protein [Rhodoferax sp.]
MSRAHSTFIPGEQLGTVTDWSFGAVDQASLRFQAKLKAQAEAELRSKDEAVRQAGHAEGYAEGFAQGHAQATLEGQRQIADYIATQGEAAANNMAQLFASAQEQLHESQQVMAKGVLELACELARQVLRHELASNPNALQPVIREAMGMLTSDCKAAVVRMNPVDIEVFAEVLRQEFSSLSMTLLPDSNVTRGGCIVEAAGTVVDGTVEKRWQRAVASLGLEASWEDANDLR